MTDTPDAQPDTDIVTDWATKNAAHNRLRAESQLHNKAILFDALAAAGITHVLVGFDGYGDSGQIENILFKRVDENIPVPESRIEITSVKFGQTEPEHLTVSLADAVEQIAYDFLEQTHCGWENNDGAYGDFTFDVAKRSITLDCNERFSDSVYSQHVF